MVKVLEMSKCITALRQSAAEKDRRYELLVLKMKRMRRAAAQESDRQSCAAGSEGSVEDSGSLGLDTIAEDLDEVRIREANGIKQLSDRIWRRWT